MAHRRLALTPTALLLLAGAASAAPDVLDLIPEDAVIGVAIRNLNDLKKRGDQLLAESEIKNLPRPSELFEGVYTHLRIKDCVDQEGSAAILLANPDVIGVRLWDEKGNFGSSWNDVSRLLVGVVPFTDRGKIEDAVGIEKGALVPGKVVSGDRDPFVKSFAVRGNHLFMGADATVVGQVAHKSKAVGSDWGAARRKALAGSDVLVHANPRAWGPAWKQLLQELEKPLTEHEKGATLQVGRQLLDSLAVVRSFSIAFRIDRGLGVSYLADFPREGHEDVRRFLAGLAPRGGRSELTGLPDGPVVAAQAVRGDGAHNAAVARLLLNVALRHVNESKLLVPAADRANVTGVFSEVWKHLQGNRLALYQNPEARGGLFSLVAILDTADPEKFLKELRQLAHLSDPAGLALSGKDAEKDDRPLVEQFIRDLGDERFAVRESASTRLVLVGEPALPFVEKALTSDDPEVRRRAEDVKTSILGAAAERRKELLSPELPRAARPAFGFVPEGETRAGQRVELVRVKLTGADAPVADKLKRLFGPEWDRLRLAVHGKHVVVLFGSNVGLLETALQNLKEGRPGLAAAKRLEPFARQSGPACKFEFHVSLQNALGLVANPDAVLPRPPGPDQVLTALALIVEPDSLRLDLWIPAKELKILGESPGY